MLTAPPIQSYPPSLRPELNINGQPAEKRPLRTAVNRNRHLVLIFIGRGMVAIGYLQRNTLRRIAGRHIGEMRGVIAVRHAVKLHRRFSGSCRAVFNI